MTNNIHNLWVGLSCLLIVGAHSASVKTRQTVQIEHDFDLGPLRCCAKPRDSDVCPDLSDYIPCPFVEDMDKREERIRMRLADYERNPSTVDRYENCSRDLAEVLCEQNFPTCVINPDGSHEVQLPEKDACEQKMESCPPFFRAIPVLKDICSLYEPESITYSVSNCTASAPSGISLTHCTVDWYIPEWGYQYLKRIDLELVNMRNDELQGLNDICWKKVKDFHCKSVGRCWAQGTRLEHINSANTCNEISSCIPSNLQRGYQQLVFGCSSLSDEQNRPLTDPTVITLTPPTRETMTPPPTTKNTSKPLLPTNVDEVTSSTSTSSASLPFILLTLVIALLAR